MSAFDTNDRLFGIGGRGRHDAIVLRILRCSFFGKFRVVARRGVITITLVHEIKLNDGPCFGRACVRIVCKVSPFAHSLLNVYDVEV
jgi:hypothetical protein